MESPSLSAKYLKNIIKPTGYECCVPIAVLRVPLAQLSHSFLGKSFLLNGLGVPFHLSQSLVSSYRRYLVGVHPTSAKSRAAAFLNLWGLHPFGSPASLHQSAKLL